MKITISKDGVNFEIEGEEILKELFRDENKCLWELKRALDKLESEITEVDFEEEPVSDEDIERLFGSQFISNAITPIIEELQSSDTKVPLPPKKSKQAIVVKRKRKYHRKHKHNKKKVKTNKTQTSPKKEVPIEREPAIIPAVRPKGDFPQLNI
jgi:hypothetical protein